MFLYPSFPGYKEKQENETCHRSFRLYDQSASNCTAFHDILYQKLLSLWNLDNDLTACSMFLFIEVTYVFEICLGGGMHYRTNIRRTCSSPLVLISVPSGNFPFKTSSMFFQSYLDDSFMNNLLISLLRDHISRPPF